MTLALLILPIIIVATREALRSIPLEMREAAYGLGADKWQVVRMYLLPAARPGILTGAIVGMSRAIGETAPIITIGALTFIAFLPPAPLQPEFPFINFDWLNSPFTVLPIQMFNWISRPQAGFHVAAAATGVILLLMTLLMNGLGDLHPLQDTSGSEMNVARRVVMDAMTQRPVTDAQVETPAAVEHPVRARVAGLGFFYGEKQALKDLHFTVRDRQVTALIGPSGCGKSTLLRAFNRLHDLYPGNRYEGEIILYPEEINIVSPDVDPMLVRLKIGMVFQKPNPFPKSIYENVAAGLWVRGIRKKSIVDERVERALRQAALWDEVKDRLRTSAYGLSGGQQQRLCIARALAPEPEMLLLDEPTSALDPIATARIEELIAELAPMVTIVIVTHNMQQAARVSDYTAFMYLGELIEFDTTSKMFTTPSDRRTQDYITGRFG